MNLSSLLLFCSLEENKYFSSRESLRHKQKYSSNNFSFHKVCPVKTNVPFLRHLLFSFSYDLSRMIIVLSIVQIFERKKIYKIFEIIMRERERKGIRIDMYNSMKIMVNYYSMTWISPYRSEYSK